jgi:hypothetical protein
VQASSFDFETDVASDGEPSRCKSHQYDEHKTQRPEIFYATIRIDGEVLASSWVPDFAGSTSEMAGV